jgi:uncharacterized protein YbaP (TraB family)
MQRTTKRSPRHPTRRAARLLAAALLAIAATLSPAAAAPALWQVKGRTGTVYLFGTLHVLPPGVKWHTPAVDRALAAATDIWTEADTPSLPYLVRLIRRYGLSGERKLSDVLPKHYRARYDLEMNSSGMKTLRYDNVKPWLAERLLTDGALHPRSGRHYVEAEILDYARHHHQDIQTFESAENQFAILADMPIDAQIKALEIQLDAYPPGGTEMNALVKAWLAGDIAALDHLSNQQLISTDERYFDDVMVRRNEQFASDLATRLNDSGVAFVAVGAAHLVGTTSVQSFLRNYGFNATRVTE